MRTDVLIKTGLLCYLVVVGHGQSMDEEDLSKIFSTEEVDQKYLKSLRLPVGTDVRLNCTCHHKNSVHWEFSPCQSIGGRSHCDYARLMNDSISWKTLEHGKKKKCRLDMRNLQIDRSGFYRCSINGDVLQVYEIDVQAFVVDVGTPQLLSLTPQNATIIVNTHLTLQCKVNSTSVPCIWWFKQSEELTKIKYGSKYYDRINMAGDQFSLVPGETQIYLSKLNIYNARESDSGVYVCAALSQSGLAQQRTVVRVVSSAAALETNYKRRITLFSLLFLIPLAFVLIPITVWLCYYRKKKIKTVVCTQEEIKFIRRANQRTGVV